MILKMSSFYHYNTQGDILRSLFLTSEIMVLVLNKMLLAQVAGVGLRDLDMLWPEEKVRGSCIAVFSCLGRAVDKAVISKLLRERT